MRTVFVDRDGVINVNRAGHVTTWEQLALLPGALDGLARLAEHGCTVVIVTNQAIVNRGIVTQVQLDEIHARLVDVITRHGGNVTGVMVCPHRPDEACGCRKPAPGMLLQAAARFGVSLEGAVMIGDHPDDLEAARRAGCRSLLVLSGRTPSWPSETLPDGCLAVLPDLQAAAAYLTDGPAPGPLPGTDEVDGRAHTLTPADS